MKRRQAFTGQSESSSQQAVIRWWAFISRSRKLPENALMAFPLQAARSPRNGARMKAEGARKGSPDMFLSVGRSNAHGLFIEMNTAVGRVSPEQLEMLTGLAARGYITVVARSSAEAISAIEIYLAT